MNELVNNHINCYNYDIRESGDARWIDQKCTPDVLAIVSDCIVQYAQDNGENIEFNVRDIWNSDFAMEFIPMIFSKPDVDNRRAENEYDKFFSQPIKLLGYSGILNVRSQSNRHYYTISNLELLEQLSHHERNALKFLQLYIEKVLKDSNIYHIFDNFFANSNSSTFTELKNNYESFIIANTPINTPVEVRRIFTKVLNPLSFKNRSLGTQRGRLSKHRITYDQLMYNRDNFRDINSEKPKHLTRYEYMESNDYAPNLGLLEYQIAKAKRIVREFNHIFNNGNSEVETRDWNQNSSLHPHHIFMKSMYPEIAHYFENLIMLTASQHYTDAHPNNSTQLISKEFQNICLIAKAETIKDSLENGNSIYSYDDFIYVLNIGFDTDNFSNIEYENYTDLVCSINEMYHLY